MLQASQPSLFVHIYEWHQQPPRSSGVARCLFGKPSAAETRRQLDEEIAKNYKRFSSRYEICQSSERRPNSFSANTSLVKSEESRRKRIESVSSAHTSKRQKLLTDYWPKSKDSSNSKYAKSS